MKEKGIIIVIIFFSIIGILNAEYQLNFFIGDVRVEVQGKLVEPIVGLIIPESAVIITGKRSQAHLYNTTNGTSVNIQPSEKVSIASISAMKQRSRFSLWNRLGKENRLGGITTNASIRGAEEGRVDVEWDVGNNDLPLHPIARERTTEWKLFGEKQYSKVLPLTEKAVDIDGIFLHAASSYYLDGSDSTDKILTSLERVIAGNAGSAVKNESYRILAAVNFERARYDRSWEFMCAATKYIPDSDIGEAGYFVLAQSAFYTNRLEEGRDYLRKMRKYHNSSQLLEKIVER